MKGETARCAGTGMKPISAEICSTGAVRAVNQDRIGAFAQGGCGLYLVADGIGGRYKGENASGTLLERCTGWWNRQIVRAEKASFERNVEDLKEVLDDAHAAIRRGTPEGEMCGSTLVLLWLQNDWYALFSAGDSRCYRVSVYRLFPEVNLLTRDDVYQPAPGTHSANAGKLTRAVGLGEHCAVSLQTGKVAGKTLFALCSDGIYKYCPERVWKKELLRAYQRGNLEESVRRISDRVAEYGARDNYSLILVQT